LPEQSSTPLLQISRERKKTYKISLKEKKSTPKIMNMPINCMIRNRREEAIYVSPTIPKISFSYLSPENKNHLRTSMIVQQKQTS